MTVAQIGSWNRSFGRTLVRIGGAVYVVLPYGDDIIVYYSSDLEGWTEHGRVTGPVDSFDGNIAAAAGGGLIHLLYKDGTDDALKYRTYNPSTATFSAAETVETDLGGLYNNRHAAITIDGAGRPWAYMAHANYGGTYTKQRDSGEWGSATLLNDSDLSAASSGLTDLNGNPWFAAYRYVWQYDPETGWIQHTVNSDARESNDANLGYGGRLNVITTWMANDCLYLHYLDPPYTGSWQARWSGTDYGVYASGIDLTNTDFVLAFGDGMDLKVTVHDGSVWSTPTMVYSGSTWIRDLRAFRCPGAAIFTFTCGDVAYTYTHGEYDPWVNWVSYLIGRDNTCVVRLQPGVHYGVRVRGINRGYLYGSWTQPIAFTTPSPA